MGALRSPDVVGCISSPGWRAHMGRHAASYGSGECLLGSLDHQSHDVSPVAVTTRTIREMVPYPKPVAVEAPTGP